MPDSLDELGNPPGLTFWPDCVAAASMFLWTRANMNVAMINRVECPCVRPGVTFRKVQRLSFIMSTTWLFHWLKVSFDMKVRCALTSEPLIFLIFFLKILWRATFLLFTEMRTVTKALLPPALCFLGYCLLGCTRQTDLV